MPAVLRRTVLSGLAALAATPLAAQGFPPGARFSRVVVDVDRLKALGLGPYAEYVRQAAADEARQVFADRIGPGGGTLVVRLTSLSMRSYTGSSSVRGSSGMGENDYLEGEALLLGPGGAVIGRKPQLLPLAASSGGAWYGPDNERRRAEIISRYYVQWLRRTLG
jgi:hypothetical protein